MWGAIIGDIAGSIYEFKQLKEIKPVECNEIISQNGFYSDDTILTVAVANAIETDRDYEKYLKLYGKKYEHYRPNFEPYFKNSFSPGYIKWVNGQNDGNSIGNGAMMRISPVGYMFNSEKEVIENAILATKPSHNSEEAIECSKIIALIIYYSRQGWPKKEILKKLNINLQYKPFQKFNTTCKETIDNCLYAVFVSSSFEESIKNVISFGGDTDTNACIVGAMAEAMYGIRPILIEKAKCKIPRAFTDIIEKEYKIKKIEDIER
jgi:ADP-ribosylglycohydrolase